MPNLDGAAALAEIRSKDGPNQFVPILAFSADLSEGSIVEGFDGAVPKPLTPEGILVALTEVLVQQLDDPDVVDMWRATAGAEARAIWKS